MVRRLSLLSLLLLLAACTTPTTADDAAPDEPADESEASYDETPAPVEITELLVSTDWLTEHLDAPNLQVLHIGNDPDAWTTSHIPGQAYIPFESIVVGSFAQGFFLPDDATLRQVFETAGVSDDTQVVLTGDLDGLMATRAFFSLQTLGRTSGVALLDGGLAQWRDENRPHSEVPDEPTAGRLTTPEDRTMVVEAPFVLERIEASDYHLVDARPAAEFNGEVAGDGVSRPGHIPSAVSIFWKSTLQQEDRPHLMPSYRIEEMYNDAGVSDEGTIVAYCRTGVQASFGYFLARMLDREVLIYDGSYIDWSADPDLPITAP